MDSMGAEEAETRNTKRARLSPPAAAGDSVDLISVLGDDVLLRVLALTGDVRDAVRTGALSRRWRGLWTRLPVLRFASSGPPAAASRAGVSGNERRAAFEQYVSFVNGVLARRARSDCAVETLSISYTMAATGAQDWIRTYDGDGDELEQLMPASAGTAAQDWIRYAFQHGVRSLAVGLPSAPPKHGRHDIVVVNPRTNKVMTLFLRGPHGYDHGDDDDTTPLVIVDDDLRSPERLETIHLALGGARLRLPSTMRFTSLVDLSLERIEITRGGGQLLAWLLSSANCPRLQKLRMSKLHLPSFNETMRLDAGVLSELWIEDVNVRSLELRAPNLRVFHIDNCCRELLRVSAPRLEELTFFQLGRPPLRLEIDDELVHVRSLKLRLRAHCPSDSNETDSDSDETSDSNSDETDSDETTDSDSNETDEKNAYMLLLKHCSSVTCLDVTLEGEESDSECEEDVDMIASNVPYLPHVTSLTVNISNEFEPHDFGVGVASLLKRFKNLKHLSLHLPLFRSMSHNERDELDLECDHPNHWTSHEISMAHLQVIELIGLIGTDCELWFMKSILTSARGLRKVAVSFDPKCVQHEGKMDAFESMLHDEGMQTSHRDAFVLNMNM
ncbi:unnamed protein product [Urochloa decumbens]|uniref:F-box domain-containing protein n=1 Tax=Urochloa decumbens TaxID=240449 RepID=A0ABC9DVT0_9POAL